MIQAVGKWLLFLFMMTIGLYALWVCPADLAIVAAVVGGACLIFVYHAFSLVWGRTRIFWPGITWSLGYFLMGAYYFFINGAAITTTWLFTLAAVSMMISAHHQRWSRNTTIWPGTALSLGLAVSAISQLTSPYSAYMVFLSVLVFTTQRRKARATIFWPGIMLATILLGASCCYAYAYSPAPTVFVAYFSLITLWLSVGHRPASTVMLLRGVWSVSLLLSAFICYDTMNLWVLLAGIMAALVNPLWFFDHPGDKPSTTAFGRHGQKAATEQRLINQWWHRPLAACYPVLLIEQTTLSTNMRQQYFQYGGQEACLITGIDTAGTMHTLGMWLGYGRNGELPWQQIYAELTQRGLRDPIMICCATPSPSVPHITRLWPNATIEVFRSNHDNMWKQVCDRIMPNVSSAEAEMVRVNNRHNATIRLFRDRGSSSKYCSNELGQYLRKVLYYHEATYQTTISHGWKPLMDCWAREYPNRLVAVE